VFMGGRQVTLRNSLALVLLTQLSGLAAADPALPTYRAEYTTTVSGIDVTLTRTLTEQAGQYQLSQSGSKTFLVKLSEDASFTVKDGRVVGDHFVYQLSGITKRRREVIFDESAGVIRSLRKKKMDRSPVGRGCARSAQSPGAVAVNPSEGRYASRARGAISGRRRENQTERIRIS